MSDLRALPLESDSADVMIAVHVLEHFYRWEAEPVLREWQRVLKPGGHLILELPCMDKVIRYLATCYQRGEMIGAQMTWWALWGDPDYHDPVMVHRWGYTQQMLMDLLREIGFQSITSQPPRYHILKRDMRVVAYKGAA